jgi:alkanesulfonate monooxygenase SsuD/methylene tetrahydromethanopterin reductase-like flavin-dependent oxidoreductase (luciferase family)
VPEDDVPVNDVAVKLGIITPIISRNPRFGAHGWDQEAGIEEIAAIVLRAEALGFAFCTFSEHLAVPVGAAAVRGGTYWSRCRPWATWPP